jgi:4-amino-4-deoxychorismate lyase
MEGAFRYTPPEGLKIIETLRWERAQGFVRLDRHLKRCAETCELFAVAFDRAAAIGALHRAATKDAMRVRLTVDMAGGIEAEASNIGGRPAPSLWRIGLSGHRLDSRDPWLRVKTTRRELYDRVRRELPPGLDEMIFANEKGEICEGTITNLFLDFGEGLLTPPLSCGLLPGVLRSELVEAGECREAAVAIGDLGKARAIWAGNSLRGLIRCQFEGGGDTVRG